MALVTDAGTPTVSNPGRALVHYAHQAGIEVVSLPGASAVTTAVAASGLVDGPFMISSRMWKTYQGRPINKERTTCDFRFPAPLPQDAWIDRRRHAEPSHGGGARVVEDARRADPRNRAGSCRVGTRVGGRNNAGLWAVEQPLTGCCHWRRR